MTSLYDFDGATYDASLDRNRLEHQLGRVLEALAGGLWMTLGELAAAAHAPEASVSARIRDLRKPKFGGYRIERRRVPGENGLFQYRLWVQQ